VVARNYQSRIIQTVGLLSKPAGFVEIGSRRLPEAMSNIPKLGRGVIQVDYSGRATLRLDAASVSVAAA
jgi:hypothetical protein